MSSTTAAATSDSRLSAYPSRWLAAIVMVGAVLMDMIDITIVNVALPTIGRDLEAIGTKLEWVVSAYMLAFAATLIIAGSFGDLLGRKRIFVGGIAVFGLASLAAGVAQDAGQLIAARIVQGAAAAAMVPQALATFRVIFSGSERGQAFGMYGAILGFASAFGLVLGGLLTDADLFGWSWRTIFLINVPVALVALVAAIRVCPCSGYCGGARHISAAAAAGVSVRIPSVAPVPKKYREVRAALSEAGWRVLRRRGSHEVWGKRDEGGRIVVAGKDSDTVPAGTLASIRRASGLEQLR
jgi:MFS family permease